MSLSDDTAPPRTLGYRRWRAVFSAKRPQGVTRTLSEVERGGSGASGWRVPLRRRGGNMRRAIL